MSPTAPSTSELGLQRAEDDEILRVAVAEDRVIVSEDTDFGALLARAGARAPSFVLIRSAAAMVELPGFRFHDLRHTANTLTAATGASTRDLMHRMGHASPQAALRYQHTSRERDTEIAKSLGELVEASTKADTRQSPRDGRGMELANGGADANQRAQEAR